MCWLATSTVSVNCSTSFDYFTSYLNRIAFPLRGRYVQRDERLLYPSYLGRDYSDVKMASQGRFRSVIDCILMTIEEPEATGSYAYVLHCAMVTV